MNEASEERTQRREGRLTVRHHFPPCQPDRMGREPQPPRLKSEAKRNGEGRQGEGTPERFSAKLFSRSDSGGDTKNKWLAGRQVAVTMWRHCIPCNAYVLSALCDGKLCKGCISAGVQRLTAAKNHDSLRSLRSTRSEVRRNDERSEGQCS